MDKRLVRAYKAKRWRENFKFNKGRSGAFSEKNLIDRLKNKDFWSNQLSDSRQVTEILRAELETISALNNSEANSEIEIKANNKRNIFGRR